MFNRSKCKLNAVRDELIRQLEIYDFQIDNCERASLREQEGKRDFDVISNLEQQKLIYEKVRENVLAALKECY